MSQPIVDFDPFATAPEPEPEPVQPLASLIRAYFAPDSAEEADAYYEYLDELHEEITERLAGREGRIMDAAPRLLDACREADAVLRELYDPRFSPPGLVARHIKAGERLQYLLADLS